MSATREPLRVYKRTRRERSERRDDKDKGDKQTKGHALVSSFPKSALCLPVLLGAFALAERPCRTCRVLSRGRRLLLLVLRLHRLAV